MKKISITLLALFIVLFTFSCKNKEGDDEGVATGLQFVDEDIYLPYTYNLFISPIDLTKDGVYVWMRVRDNNTFSSLKLNNTEVV